METKIKILICGDVNGKFNTLFSRVQTLHKKAGPFDMLICVGKFFGPNNKELEPYRNGDKKVVIPTYILGPSHEEDNVYYSDPNGCEVISNVTYLGKRGLYSPSDGLKIAYLSGTESRSGESDPFSFNQKDAMALKVACIRNQSAFRGVDFLLTQQWPQFIGDQTVTKEYNGSETISWLAAQLRPRYHFAGGEEIYFERKPYRNETQANDAIELATRFISLAPVGDKTKWIYALSVSPLEKMRMTELCQKTTDETVTPFPLELLRDDIFAKPTKSDNNHKQYFYDMNAPDDRGKRKKGDHNREKRPRPEFDQSKCWFCLGSPNVSKHLVISIGNECYLALAKGGLTIEHLLISPITHHQATVGLPEASLEEVHKFKVALTSYFRENGDVPIFFERNYKTSHLQIHVIPIPKKMADPQNLHDLFMGEAVSHGFNLEELEKNTKLKDIIPQGVPYFVVELPDGTVLYTKIRGQFPLEFGRSVLAGDTLLDMPNRIEWQNCKINETEEVALTQRFRKMFQPFDFTT